MCEITNKNKKVGIYIHIPFCAHKCPYCDFYSKKPAHMEMDSYKQALIERIELLGKKYSYGFEADTVYFGGGTPSLMGGDALCEILGAVKTAFKVEDGAEVTVEANPESVSGEFFRCVKAGGFNRLSMGLQSANEDELRLLGRAHSCEDVARAVGMARQAGIENITLDLMLGLPGQTESKLSDSIDFCADLKVPHLSSYILKVEENTVFGRKNLQLPEDDSVSDLYLFAALRLKELGYKHYEISNFAREGFESRHNLKYWHCEEYLGIGPGAHSFLEGKRFCFNPHIKDFMAGAEPIDDGTGGDFEEYAMLNLRLADGLVRKNTRERFSGGDMLFEGVLKKAMKIPQELIIADNKKIALTTKGFLVSNAIIGKIIL